MNRILKDKRGGEKWLTWWLFLIWILIGGGIVAGVLIFYSSQTDVRGKEAEILNFKIADCLEEIDFNSDSFNIFEDCKINQNLIENSELYYVNISIDKKSFEYGVFNFEILCELSEKSESFPKCYENTFYIHKDKTYLIKILTASNQLGARI